MAKQTSSTSSSPDDLTRVVEEYRTQGFVCIRQALSEQEVARFQQVAREAAQESATLHHDQEGNPYLHTTANIWRTNDALNELACHPKISAIATKLAGMPLRVWGGEVYLKEPQRSQPTTLHDDLPFEPFDSRATLTAWIALDDVPVERGCMTFLPGSHLRGGPERANSDDLTEKRHTYMVEQWPELEWYPRVTVPLRAGDLTFHHVRLAHMAGAPMSGKARISFTVTFMDAEATYRPVKDNDPLDLSLGDPLPHDLFPRIGA